MNKSGEEGGLLDFGFPNKLQGRKKNTPKNFILNSAPQGRMLNIQFILRAHSV